MSNSASISAGRFGGSASASDMMLLVGLGVILLAPRLFGRGLGEGAGAFAGGLVSGTVEELGQVTQESIITPLSRFITETLMGGLRAPQGSLNSILAGYGRVSQRVGAKLWHWEGGPNCYPTYGGKKHALYGDKRALETLVFAAATAGLSEVPDIGMYRSNGNKNLLNGHYYGRAIDVPSIGVGESLVHTLSGISPSFAFVSMKDGFRYEWRNGKYNVVSRSSELVKDHKGHHWHIELPLAKGFISSWVMF